MASDREQLNLLVSRLDGLRDSKYLLADKKISEILKIIAGSEVLFHLFEFCTTGFDYYKVKNSCFIVSPEGEKFFKRPKSDKDFLAFAFSLFYEFDIKKADLFKTLTEYFNAGQDLKDCYEVFVEKLVLPFKEVVLRTATAMIVETEKELGIYKEQPMVVNSPKEETTSKTQVEFQPESKAMDGRFADEARRLLSEDKISIMNYKINDTVKSEIIMLLEALDTAIFEGEKTNIVFTFTAYKYAVMNFRKMSVNMVKLTSLLRRCGVV